MRFSAEPTHQDVEAIRRKVNEALTARDAMTVRRDQYKADGPAREFSKGQCWETMVVCLLTTQQRSGKGSPTDRFSEQKPVPLGLAECEAAGNGLESFVEQTIKNFGGIRRGPTIAKQLDRNLAILNNGGWDNFASWHNALKTQIAATPDWGQRDLERHAARYVDLTFAGFGPKQSRNLWQMLCLTRWETPLDSRVTKWMNANLSCSVDSDQLGDEKYYEAVLDFVQSACRQAEVLPCVFDAAAFDYERTAVERNPGTRNRGTTATGYINRNQQVTIRNTGIQGTDHLQYVYQLACSNCGHTYGANGSDIHDRKCPKCQGGAAGVPLAKTAEAIRPR